MKFTSTLENVIRCRTSGKWALNGVNRLDWPAAGQILNLFVRAVASRWLEILRGSASSQIELQVGDAAEVAGVVGDER